MRFRSPSLSAAVLIFALPIASKAADSPASETPNPVAATRPELKEQLERSKHSHPRLPLPPPTAEEIANAKARGGRGPMTGIINNGRMRKMYLPAEVLGGGFSREPDPAMTLDNTFKTMFFWIVSRANNCTYCSGHQEVKLAGDGVKEETIAALDGDWSPFTDAERAAFAFTVKLTYEPNKLTDADIDRLRKHYTDLQILEIITAVGGFNAMNRWTGPLAIPQEDHRVYLTPTPEPFKTMRSKVAPLPDGSAAATTMTCAKPADRGSLETRDQVEAALDACRKRTPRLPLASEEKARGGGAGRLVRLRSTPRVGPSARQLPQGGQSLGRPDLSLSDQGPPQSQAQSRNRLRRGPQRPRLVRFGPRSRAVEGARHRRRRDRPSHRVDPSV